ncbi:hypothetical protein BC937DRAFT_94373 [Endogone sp. FLAS-F59071]|nr:hypothetical protein BC937DRAFT_94373 [Endogone sp. FLAS-F59071]|eukprot:RUS20794.1 hypothetical protein BC937DRAFT_94373 [Endogone sp. FLAS-F59071]
MALQEMRSHLELPDIQELSNVIEKTLNDDVKIPIPQGLFNMFTLYSTNNQCTPNDVGIIFKVSNIENLVASAIFNDPPPADTTENGFIYFWDSNIRILLQNLVPTGQAVRNTSRHMST